MKKLKFQKKDSYLFYNIVSKILVIFSSIWFNPKIIGKENIPLKGKCILAGNHVSDFDSFLLFASTKRPIHILAKIELFKGPLGWAFKKMHLIPVDRSKKNPEAINKGIEILNNEDILGIFPEGTYHKETILLPFKGGVINFATKSNAPIIPFAIKGNFKFRSHPTIEFGKPININGITAKDKLEYLENTIKDMLTKTDSK